MNRWRLMSGWSAGVRGGSAAIGLALAAVTFAWGGASAASAQAFGNYDFESPPATEANRIYGVNRKTGDMSACQFERPAGSTVGITRCFERGEGAGPQKAGRYGLVSTRYMGETGVFRVNYETGEMSICYIRDTPRPDGKPEPIILCTAQAR